VVTETDRFQGCLLGLATGDAVGTALAFQPPHTFQPIVDMVGGGPFNLKPGQWTDDTSMALCLASSLVERHGFDPRDQIERYCRWAREGYLSSAGRGFDIGNTVRAALARYQVTGDACSGSLSPTSAGNGSIMRLAPVAMYYFPDHQAIEPYTGESSRTTHGTQECGDACRLLAGILGRALAGQPKEEVLGGAIATCEAGPRIAAIARGEYRHTSPAEVRGGGYVVVSLEAALWCFNRSNSFEAAILSAANLGDDADTTAAVCGQVPGAYYGAAAIPSRWLARLAQEQLIRQLAIRLQRSHERGPTSARP
jgi:ADP-ribosyl-[dinitrogen reductase] hydrolase